MFASERDTPDLPLLPAEEGVEASMKPGGDEIVKDEGESTGREEADTG